jgi:NAD+ diphosphatase
MSTDRPRLDRAAERRKDIDFLEARLERTSTRFVPIWREQLIAVERSLVLPTLHDARELVERASELVFLGMYDGEACFGLDVSQLSSPGGHLALQGAETLVDPRSVFTRLSAEEADLALYARGLLYWHGRHRYCGACGRETRPRDGGHNRVCSSAECGLQVFPHTDPCVLVLVHDGEQCLLGRQPGWPKGMYSALAGFVEPCESLEEAAAREVLEEAGIEITQVRYAESQPWPFPASLMVGFFAAPRSRDIRLHDEELEDARWFTRDELKSGAHPGLFVPPPYSLAGRLIGQFLASTP